MRAEGFSILIDLGGFYLSLPHLLFLSTAFEKKTKIHPKIDTTESLIILCSSIAFDIARQQQ